MSYILSLKSQFINFQSDTKNLFEHEKYYSHKNNTIKIRNIPDNQPKQKIKVFKSFMKRYIYINYSSKEKTKNISDIEHIFNIYNNENSKFAINLLTNKPFENNMYNKSQINTKNGNNENDLINNKETIHVNNCNVYNLSSSENINSNGLLNYDNYNSQAILNVKSKPLINKDKKQLNNYKENIIYHNKNCNCDINVDYKRGWIILNSLYDNIIYGYRLKKGEILKLGRISFKIRDTSLTMKNSSINELSIEDNSKSMISKNNEYLCDDNYIYNNNCTNLPQLFKNNSKENNVLALNNNICNNLNKTNTNYNNTILINSANNNNLNNKILHTNIINKHVPKSINYIRHKSLSIHNTCRVCLLEETDKMLNPLISVCKCTGSVAFIHLECLKKWLDSKLQTKVYAFLIVHSFKDLNCEICNSNIPERIIIKNKVIYLINLKLPDDDDYIILETLGNEKKDVKFLYIIHMPKNTKLLMGRSADCDIRMTDISISRVHCFLENRDGVFYLKDNNSKFGSLVKLQSDCIILPNKTLSIQFEDCIINMKLIYESYNCLCFNSFFVKSNKIYNYSSSNILDQQDDFNKYVSDTIVNNQYENIIIDNNKQLFNKDIKYSKKEYNKLINNFYRQYSCYNDYLKSKVYNINCGILKLNNINYELNNKLINKNTKLENRTYKESNSSLNNIAIDNKVLSYDDIMNNLEKNIYSESKISNISKTKEQKKKNIINMNLIINNLNIKEQTIDGTNYNNDNNDQLVSINNKTNYNNALKLDSKEIEFNDKENTIISKNIINKYKLNKIMLTQKKSNNTNNRSFLSFKSINNTDSKDLSKISNNYYDKNAFDLRYIKKEFKFNDNFVKKLSASLIKNKNLSFSKNNLNTNYNNKKLSMTLNIKDYLN